LAEYKRSVLYSRLPAQLFILLFDAQADKGEITGLAANEVMSLMKVLLFKVEARAESASASEICSTWH